MSFSLFRQINYLQLVQTLTCLLLVCLCLPAHAQLTSPLSLKSPEQISPENATKAKAIATESMQVSDGAISAREVIGEGDQLLVTVFGQPDLTADVTVGESGVITLPLVGVIDTKGKTATEIAALFASRLEQGQYVRNPKVVIKVLQQLSRTFSVLGEVQRPGRYPLPSQLSLLDALSLAGGLNGRADRGVSVIRRGQGQTGTETIDYIPLRIDPQTKQTPDKLNQKILPNDVLFVSAQKTFYIYGEVRKPGNYPIEEDLTVMRILSIGGGVTERGSTRRMTIYRKTEDGGIKEIPAKITDQVLPGDVLFVNERLF
ncbi:SLBB domain-containing protein [Undibacterium sp. Jales W-56]|uniref:SLBB domain-containing protein n=1 Tax=Undibacterium sp. Jales W-56 TaxID=2897325 RepID=UPI0021CE48BC|nr:SLBB domain-containing protein [Undibacterium sp. Jales W-56]MCU6433258.1 SLBB domain-containing protein [Undibacterium sp. Jales W-56]